MAYYVLSYINNWYKRSPLTVEHFKRNYDTTVDLLVPKTHAQAEQMFTEDVTPCYKEVISNGDRPD